MTDVVVLVVGSATGDPIPHDNRYLVAWNPHTQFGVLQLTSTDDPAKARRFANASIALTEWRTISNVQRLRPDGKPNRPLMGVNIEISAVDQATHPSHT